MNMDDPAYRKLHDDSAAALGEAQAALATALAQRDEAVRQLAMVRMELAMVRMERDEVFTRLRTIADLYAVLKSQFSLLEAMARVEPDP